MKSNAKLSAKRLYLIMIPCAIIIFFTSIETMMRVKDLGLFQEWLKTLEGLNTSEITQNQAFEAYLTANLTRFLFKIIIPVALSINSYLAYKQTRINQLFVFVWSVLVLGGLAYTFVELSYTSVFYYINIAGYIVLFLVILSLSDVISESKLS